MPDSTAPRQPRHAQLLLPLLAELAARGGQARPRDLYDPIADRLSLPAAVRDQTATVGGQTIKLYPRRVRWVEQTAKAHGLIAQPARGLWRLTDQAARDLPFIRRGLVVTVLTTADDAGLLFWAYAQDALTVLHEGSVDLIWTSPPYPLQRDGKGYGTQDSRTWLREMIALCAQWIPLLSPTGSLMIELGHVYEPGRPAQDIYPARLEVALRDQLGLYCCQHLYSENPTHLPTPLPWTVTTPCRTRPTIEPILWFAPDPAAVAADNRRVLRPYTAAGRRALRQPTRQAGNRPSGITFGPASFARDNGGSIPADLIRAPGGTGNRYYYDAERRAGQQPGPAVTPEPLLQFCISLATQPGALIYNPFCGTATTCKVAHQEGRRWIGSDRNLDALRAAARRLTAAAIPHTAHWPL